MENIKYQAEVKFLQLKGRTKDEIKSGLDSIHCNHSPSIATVKLWTGEFRRGRTSIFDEDRLGRSKEVATEKMIEKKFRKLYITVRK